MEVDSPPAARREARREVQPLDSPQGPTHTAIKEVEGFLKGRGLLERIGNAWGRVKMAALKGVEPQGGKDASGPPTQAQDIQDIKATLTELTKKVQDIKEQGKPKKPTYAEAARGQGPSGYIAQSNARTLPVPKRHYQESLIRLEKATASQENFSEREWVRKANEAIGQEAVLRIRKLPSGDMIIRFKDKEGKEKWEKNPELWKKAFGQEARCQAREYIVLAFGVQVESFDQKEQVKSIEEIYTQNPLLRNQVRIARIGWAKRTLQQGRVHAALHIGVATPEQANVLIEQGLYLGQVHHHCEPFFKECQVNQCVKCHDYRHMAKHCLKGRHCGYCASKGHASEDCPKKDSKEAYRCIVCKDRKANHTAWAQECPVRRREQERARQAYKLRPKQFQEREQVQEKVQEQVQEPRWDNQMDTISPTSSGEGSDIDMEIETPRVVVPSALEFNWIAGKGPTLPELGFIFDKSEGSQSKRKERPTNLSKVAKGTQDLRTVAQWKW
jgi:hypothetical protein